MAAKKSKRLAPVLKMAERNRQMAEQALARAQQQLLEEQGKLEQLYELVEGYENQSRLEQAGGVQTSGLIRMQQFLSKMQQAIDQQKEQVAISEQMMAHSTGLWQVAQGRYKAMSSLIERHQEVEYRAADKQVQREIDELVQNRFSIKH